MSVFTGSVHFIYALYIFTAWAKTNGCKNDPSRGKTCGAYVSLKGSDIPLTWKWHNNKKWEKIEVEFFSGSSTEVTINLGNGFVNEYSKGTVWYSDTNLKVFYPWSDTYKYNKTKTTYSVDTKTVHGDAEYSIKITNEDYNLSYVTIPFDVQKNTTYKVSAWVKCSDYSLAAAKKKDSGACISIPGNTKNNKYKQAAKMAVRSHSNEWTKLEFTFDSGNNTSYPLAFYNGMWYSDAKGTVYFSDISIEPVYPWDTFTQWKKNVSTVEVDKKNVYGDADHSIKITNSDYNMSNVQKTFKVEKNTHYRASVMAKSSDYKLDERFKNDSGAAIGKPENNTGAQSYNGSEWKRIYYEFDSTEYTVALYNGLWSRDCKGTVWFSDFKLEECEPTNKWNVLTVIFRNVEAPVELDGDKYIYKESFDDADVAYLSETVEGLYSSLPILADGRWSINSIDIYDTDTTINELMSNGTGYRLDFYSPTVSKELDKYIKKAESECGKVYNQIIVISPLAGVSRNWTGLGGKKYNNIFILQANYKPGSHSFDYDKNFEEALFVHEMLHCVDSHTRNTLKLPCPVLHSNVKDPLYKTFYTMKQSGWNGWGRYLSDYIRSETIDKRGLYEESFYVIRDSEVVYGTPFSDSYPRKDASALTVSVIDDQAYTGAEIKPSVTVKDGTKLLTIGKDYSVRYIDNTEIGVGAVVIEGMGSYFGNIAQTFRITPNSTSLKVSERGGSFDFSWNKVSGADKYELFYSEDGGTSYKLLQTVDGTKASTSVLLDTGKSYQFRIRSYKEIYPQKFYSSYSAVVKA